MIKKEIVLAGLLLLAGCAPVKESQKEPWKPSYRVQAGINKGGITENTDFSEMENTEVDAFSGATSLGVHAGGRVQLPVRRNSFEAGLDFSHNKQQFTFSDTSLNYQGQRDISLYQCMVPLVYNFGIYRKHQPEGLFQIKLGYLLQFNFPTVTNESGIVPNHSFLKFSSGPVLGIASTPFELASGQKIGFYVDVYRGSQIYKDVYNRDEFEEPGSSFVRGGVLFHF